MQEDLHALAHELHSRFASLIPASKRGGRLRTTDVRAVLEALVYWHSSGCAWRDLPPPPRFPPWPTVYAYYRLLSGSGAWTAIRAHLDRMAERAPDHAAFKGRGAGRPPRTARDLDGFLRQLQGMLDHGKAVSARADRSIDRYRSFTAEAAEAVREQRTWIDRRAASPSDPHA